MRNLGRDTNAIVASVMVQARRVAIEQLRYLGQEKKFGFTPRCVLILHNMSRASQLNVLIGFHFRQLCALSKMLRWNSFAFYWGRPQQPLRSLLLDVPLHVITREMCVRVKNLSAAGKKIKTPPLPPPHCASTISKRLWPTVSHI